MQDVTRKGKTTPSPKNESLVPVKEDPKKEAADQKTARIAGAVALVAAEFQVTVSEVHGIINVELGYQYAQDNNLELFATLKHGYQRCVTVGGLLRTMATNLGAAYEAGLVSHENWIAVYDEAIQQAADPLDAMTKHYQELIKQSKGSSSKPKKGLTETQKDRLQGSAFKVDTAEMKASRQRAKETRENKARQMKVAAARKKAAGGVDAAAKRQLSDDDDDDDDEDDISIGDMRM